MGGGTSNGIDRAAKMAKEGKFEASEETFEQYIDETPYLNEDDTTAWVEYVKILINQEDHERGMKHGLAFLRTLDPGSFDEEYQQAVTSTMCRILLDGARQIQDLSLFPILLNKADEHLSTDSIGRGFVLAGYAPCLVDDSWDIKDPEVAPVLANYGNRHAAVGNVHTAFILWYETSADMTGRPSVDVAMLNSHIFASALQLSEVGDFDKYWSISPPQKELEMIKRDVDYDHMPVGLLSVLQAALGEPAAKGPAALRADVDMGSSDVTLPTKEIMPDNQENVRRLAAAEVLEALQ